MGDSSSKMTEKGDDDGYEARESQSENNVRDQ